MISEPAIDKRTEEKMFFGTLAPEDAPPELARVAVLLRAAARPRTDAGTGSLITDTEKLRQQQVVAAMAAAIAAGPAAAPAAVQGNRLWKAMSAFRPRWAGGRARLVLVMTLGLMVVSASMAFAGVLPSPVQHVASVLFSKVGVHVPDRGHGATSHGPGNEPGSPSGHDKVTGSGDHGKGTDHGKHTGQEKNGNRGKHTGEGTGGGHQGDHGHHGGAGNGGNGGHEGSGHGGSSGGGDSHGGGGDSHGSGDGGNDGDNGHDGGSGQGGSGQGGGGNTGHDVLTPTSR